MSGEDAFRLYGAYLNAYEREEVKQFEIVYFLNPNIKRKNIVLPPGGLQDPEQLEDNSGNYGFDGEDGEYIYENHDHINYRYEIIKKLGKGAFGVVLRCLDHMTNEQVALKILKNQKKLHKQGKIEINILTLLRDDDPDNKKNIVFIKDGFTFRNHVVSKRYL